MENREYAVHCNWRVYKNKNYNCVTAYRLWDAKLLHAINNTALNYEKIRLFHRIDIKLECGKNYVSVIVYVLIRNTLFVVVADLQLFRNITVLIGWELRITAIFYITFSLAKTSRNCHQTCHYLWYNDNVIGISPLFLSFTMFQVIQLIINSFVFIRCAASFPTFFRFYEIFNKIYFPSEEERERET